MKNADRLKKVILAETKRAYQLKGRCIFIDLDIGIPRAGSIVFVKITGACRVKNMLAMYLKYLK